MLNPTTKFKTLFTDRPLTLQCGKQLGSITAAYQTYGVLNQTKDNVVLICHALTGNAHAAGIITAGELENSAGFTFLHKYNKMNLGKPGWWDPLIGGGKVFDTSRYFVICINIPGSCYGSTGPSSPNSDGIPYGMELPVITVRDVVNVQKALLDSLGITGLKAAAGGSLGGMQVLEWGIMYPDFVEKIIPIASSAAHSPWAVAVNQVERNAIMNDPDWNNGRYSAQPEAGLKNARRIAMITYRTYESFGLKFGRVRVEPSDEFSTNNIFQVENYLNYQGEKLINRFDANTYIYLTYMMDYHDTGLGRGGVETALSKITARTLVAGISGDVLYHPEEQKKIASCINGAEYKEITSIHGHDAFLIEFDQLSEMISDFL